MSNHFLGRVVALATCMAVALSIAGLAWAESAQTAPTRSGTQRDEAKTVESCAVSTPQSGMAETSFVGAIPIDIATACGSGSDAACQGKNRGDACGNNGGVCVTNIVGNCKCNL